MATLAFKHCLLSLKHVRRRDLANEGYDPERKTAAIRGPILTAIQAAVKWSRVTLLKTEKSPFLRLMFCLSIPSSPAFCQPVSTAITTFGISKMVSKKMIDVNRVSTSGEHRGKELPSPPDTWQLVEALYTLAIDDNIRPATEKTAATAADQPLSRSQENTGDLPAPGSVDDNDIILNKDVSGDAIVNPVDGRDTPFSSEDAAVVPSAASGMASPSTATTVKKNTIKLEFAPDSPPPALPDAAHKPSKTVKNKTTKLEFAPSPLPSPPAFPDVADKPSKLCRSCDRPATPKIVGPENENDNVGRPYYACDNKVRHLPMYSPQACPRYRTKYEQGWVAWRDNKGVHETNPLCFCGSPSRQDRIGKDEGKRGQSFWSCAEGDCNYHSQDIMGKTVWCGERVAFMPWLI
ncbi:uncharacterized protein MYCFIDRAFT_178146 [Pseudocercospora fijiensis CIRAD86]|uniref:GRF-like zinc ribbon domain-containing protein n=1 Tax=Pseudocercospora fijiensis (strain CIRAD86) TaxID=383855 RepID=M3AQ37_PSEFD|nr:uncharacterized protein MYCFIDRAFT_178146 [Pseudocercospora fijiensis CIRAD86]EME79557.1 hypothetical protein MYCFIDRAFT_178146 [Pseudocercospora fijiensis CIRAD86]